MSSIGERIKSQRKKLGLTQPQIKELADISSGTLSDIENGKALPATPSLIKLSKALKCSIDWILIGEPPISEGSLVSDKRENELLNNFRMLSAEEQEEFLEILQARIRRIKKKATINAKSSLSETKEQNSNAS